MFILKLSSDCWRTVSSRYSSCSYPFFKKYDIRVIPHINVVHVYPKQRNTLRVLLNVDHKRLYPLIQGQCMYCSNKYLRTKDKEGEVICTDCKRVCYSYGDNSYIDSFGPSISISYKNQSLPRHRSSYTHKRYNHFRTWLLRLQGKQAVKISKEDMMTISKELHKVHLTHPHYDDMRYILKKLGLNRYYNHIFYLILCFTGNRVIDLTKEQENELLTYFSKIQTSFMNGTGKRINMLSYAYLIKKFSELLGWTELSLAIPIMKSRQKIIEQDKAWKILCVENGFKFIPSQV